MAKMGCAKCGGTKKMALGGSAVKKAPVQLYGIPQQNMGTSSQMGFGKKGGTLNEMARGVTKKSTASKPAQAAAKKVLAAKAFAARTAGANQANAGKIASKPVNRINRPVRTGFSANVTPAPKTTPLSSKPANRTSRPVRSGSKQVSKGNKPVKTGSKQIKTGKNLNYKVGIKPIADKKVVTPKVVTPRTRGGVSKGNTPGVANKYANKPTIKPVAPILGPDTRKKTIIKNAGKISTKTKDATKEAAKTFKEGRKMNQSVLTAERYKNAGEKSSDFVSKMKKYTPGGKIPKMKLGKKALIAAAIVSGGAALTAMLSKKSSDKPVTPKPVTPKPVAKSSGSTKKYTSPNTGTTTIINTKPNGEKQTKVTTYGGQSSYKSTHVNPKGSPVLDKVKKAAEDAKGNKAGDGSSLKRPTNLKPTTKTDTNANGTKTTIYTDASGNRHVKVVKKDGTTFTSNDTPKAATTPKVETKKTTTTPKKTTPKVTPKVTPKMVDENKNGISDFVERPADEVTKMETKKPSDLKIIEPATKTSSTSSSSTPSSSTSTTVPRANVINRVRGSINASRERRAEKAEARGNNEKATKLRKKEEVTKAKMMKKGGTVNKMQDGGEKGMFRPPISSTKTNMFGKSKEISKKKSNRIEVRYARKSKNTIEGVGNDRYMVKPRANSKRSVTTDFFNKVGGTVKSKKK